MPDTVTTSLEGKHALVCGASAGIGRATALALAAAGADVTALARSRDRLEALVPELTAAGAAAARFIDVDLEDAAGSTGAVETLTKAHGPIHILINNAGGPAPGPILEAEEEAFVAAFARHVLASHRLVKLLLPGMRAQGYGRIVNVISTSVREPIPGLGVSNTIRGAMASWSKTVSKELPPGVTINNLLPGYTDTERLGEIGKAVGARTGRSIEEVREGWLAVVPEGRLAEPAEPAAMIAFLVSPAGAYIRGQSIAVDGGRMGCI